MSILEKLNKAIMEKDGAAAGELVHDDYKMFSHLKGEYVHMGKAGMVEAVSKGMMSPCLLYTSPSPRDRVLSRMPSSA